MPRMFLHIGTHKTGTTSIQRFCGANRDALRRRGLWYPPADVGNFPSHYAHHRIAHAIAGREPAADAADAADFFERVRKRAKNDEAILISAEPMYRHMLPAPKLAGGQAKLTDDERDHRFTDYARAVRDSIGDFDVTVLVMVRRQDKFVESLYAEQILSTGYTRSIEQFASERHFLLDYETRLAGWAECFGDDHIAVKVFDPAASTDPIEREFIEWLGLGWGDDLKIGPRHNVTPSRALVEFKRLLNSPGQSLKVNNQLRMWIDQLNDKIPADELPDLGSYYLQPRDRVELLDQFAACNRAVAERFCGRSELFADDVASDLAKYVDRRSLTQPEYRALTKRMVRIAASARDEAKPARRF